MLQTTKRVLSLLLALVMVIGLLPVIHGYAAGATEPPVMDADDASWDIPLSNLSVSCGDYERNGGSNEGPANLAVDGNTATMWHTDWEGTSRDNHWFQFQVNGDYAVCGLRYLPRQTGNSNGTITQYKILVSDDGVNFRSVATGNWAANSSWKIAQFPGENVKYVRLVALNAESDNDWVFASAAEIRLAYLPTEVSDADKTALNALIAECEQIQQGNYTGRSWQQLQSALEKARTIAANPYASQTQVDEAYALLAQAKNGLKEKVEGEGLQIIFHLDSGRKYFSKDWTIALLNELSAAGYTHLQLAFGNNGLRFVLDDMSVTANGTTYDSDELKEGIDIGNYNYGALTGYYVDGAESLTEDEMDEIIAHGKAVGVEIIPHLNMPGHMSALLDAMEYVGINNPHFTGRVESDSSVDLTNEEAINFMYALVEKYAAYFAERGVKYFHIGADEYANDAYNGSMGFPSMGSALYQKFADFVNANARIVMDHGMTPRAWNDGIYYGSYTSQFDSGIEINYWSSGWGGYTLARASTLDGKGHGLVNTNGDYYFILGKDDRFTPGSSSRHDPNEYEFCANFDMNRFMDGSVIDEPLGGMFCLWADYPGAETEQEVGANIRLVLRAMALGMEGLGLDGMYTGVVPGGFNEDGSINESEVHRHSYTNYVSNNDATCTEDGTETAKCDGCEETHTRTVADSALGHDYGEPTFVWAEDNTAKAVFTCERDEKHTHEETATVTSERAEGDCKTKATTTYTATVTFEDETYTDTKTVEGEIGDHPGDTNNDHKCDKCGAELSECADADKNHKCDLCGAELSQCADADKNHKCDLCGAELSECADTDKNHKCDLCGAELSQCADADKNHKCDICGKVLTECVDENKDYKCDICGKDLEKPEDPTDPEQPEQPEKPVIEDVTRLAGSHRWETSLKVADEMKANLGLEKFDSIIIASGNDFADALAGSYLSTVKNAPILLGWGKGGKYVTLDEANIAYIKANLAEGGTVYILGGKNAVPELYENELKGYNVKRLGGANRFETNLLILEEAGVAEGSEILVCTSTNFADSLSASATAKPILLVFNEYGKLYGKQPEFLSKLKNCTFTVIGGESAVSADLAKAIEAYGKVERLAGANRFETSVMVAQKYFKAPETAVLAYAWNYPDGLCGGSLAYSLKAPLILTMTKYEAKAVEYAKNAGIEIGLVLGGDTLISDEAVRAIFAMDKADEIVEK